MADIPLSPRQQEVCDLLIMGKSNKDIGLTLGISYRTVEDHREMVYRKLNVRSVVELVRKVEGLGGHHEEQRERFSA